MLINYEICDNGFIKWINLLLRDKIMVIRVIENVVRLKLLL